MSHSVFKDFDEDKNSSNCNSRSDAADNHLVVFIDKDGDVQVDPNGLQNLIVNANTEKKSTVSVIRLGSPTPSMESDQAQSPESNEDKDDEESDSEDSENSVDSERDNDSETEADKKRRKKKNKVPSVSLTVEEFYNPQQAAELAAGIMNIAGITNPKQLKADVDHLRYIIQNDHCYTPFTYADSLNEDNEDKSDASAKGRDPKAKTNVKTTPVANALTKKINRSAQSSKLNGLDKESQEGSARKRSMEDTNSPTDNADRTSDEEEAESETDYSDFTVSESDNDRDSDLDFSVNDCHSRRTRKIKKRKQQAKKMAAKKRRHSTIDNATGSDDGLTPNRKKATKLPKKSLNTSAKTPTTVTPTVSTIKSPTAQSTPRLTKITYIKETPPAASQSHSDDSLRSSLTKKKLGDTSTVLNATITATQMVDAKLKPTILIRQKVEKKVHPQSDALLSDMSSLFSTPDIIKKVGNASEQQGALSSSVDVSAKSMVSNTYCITPKVDVSKTFTPANKLRTQPVKLESEQDKQLDLIDSLVQEELNKTDTEIATPVSTQSNTLNFSSDIPNIVKMLETPEPPTTVVSSDLSSASINTSSAANMQMTYSAMPSTNDSQLLPDDLLDDCLPDDLLKDVAKLVEDKNVQEVLDQQVLGVASISQPAPIQSTMTTTTHRQISLTPQQVQKPHAIITTQPMSTLPKTIDEKLVVTRVKAVTPVLVGTTTPTSTKPNGKEPIQIRRPDGRIITLPPIEAPTTRGAKRRAEITPKAEQQQKQRIVTVVLQTETNTPPKSQTEIHTQPKPTVATPTSTQDKADDPLANAIKAKPIAGRERRASMAVKRASIDATPKRSLSISNPPLIDDNDYDDEEDGSDGSYNSEDDPHRLWCICRQPHNNRFMICCDKCEEWFHGKCVGITKQMGSDMEKRGAEWICPNCIKKQQPSIKNIFPRKVVNVENVANKTPTKDGISVTPSLSTPESQATTSHTTNCIVCGKTSRISSIYCSDDCIRKHASSAKITVTSPTSHVNTSTSPVSSVSSLKSVEAPRKMVKTIQPKISSPVPGLFKDKQNHVVLFDKSSGKFLIGKNSPTADKLQQWLDEHPTHEVLKPGTAQAAAFKAKQMQLKALAKDMNVEKELFAVNQPTKIQTTLRFDSEKKIMYGLNPPGTKQSPSGIVKRLSSSTTPSPGHQTPKPTILNKSYDGHSKTPKATTTPTQKNSASKKRPEEAKTPSSASSSSGDKSNEREKIRVNARKTLIEQLLLRTKEVSDKNAAKLTESEITDFVTAAEAEMFAMFGHDTNMKYKSKYRSLMFNIKDRKNKTLFDKISNKAIEPKQLVRLSPEELASQELAKWRENENKHQLEMITKSELDMLACGKSYVLKTHKGEEVIQENTDRITLDPSINVQDVVSVLNSSTVSSSSEIAASSTANTPIIVKDNRYDKYLGIESGNSKSSSNSSSKRDGDRHGKDRHESKSSSSSSKHKRKRSRERSNHSHSRDKSRDEKDRDKDKERSSSSRKDKKDHKSSSSSSGSSRSKHHEHSDKDKKLKKDSSSGSKSASTTPKVPKIDENIANKILKAQSAIDSVLHPEEFKKNVDETKQSADAAVPVQGESTALVRQTSITESDQEPTSTVTIPTPPEGTPEFISSTSPVAAEKPTNPIIWSGTISMIDVATFQISLTVMSGSVAGIDFGHEFDIVGRITPETVWDYIDKARISKDIVLVRFQPKPDKDNANAYKTFLSYLDTRRRLGVIQSPTKLVKDFYILPLTAHKSLPTVLKTTTGVDLEANRPDLLLGIIVRNKPMPVNAPLFGQKPVHRALPPFAEHKQVINLAPKDVHYTPPSSPNMGHVQSFTKQPIKSFSTDLDDDEPYSPGGSDDNDLTLNTISSSFLAGTSSNPAPIAPTSSKSDQENQIQREMEELQRQIEAEKQQIALHLQGVVDEPYSPTNSVSPPITTNISDVVSTSSNSGIPGLANISIPSNLADILKNINAASSHPGIPGIGQYNPAAIDTSIDAEYVPTASAGTSSMLSYASATTTDYSFTTSVAGASGQASEPSKLAQLTDEELLRLVPDEIELAPPKRPKYELRPPGIDDDEEIPL